MYLESVAELKMQVFLDGNEDQGQDGQEDLKGIHPPLLSCSGLSAPLRGAAIT